MTPELKAALVSIEGVLRGRLGTHEHVVAALDGLQVVETALADHERAMAVPRFYDKTIGEWKDRAVAAEAERDTLRQALERYGEHDVDCAYVHIPQGACECGLGAVLAGEEPT